MNSKDMRRDLKVMCEGLGLVTLVVPIGPHEMQADDSAIVKPILESEELESPAVFADDFVTVVKPATFRRVFTEGGHPPPSWMGLTEKFEMRVVDAARCEPANA